MGASAEFSLKNSSRKTVFQRINGERSASNESTDRVSRYRSRSTKSTEMANDSLKQIARVDLASKNRKQMCNQVTPFDLNNS